MENELDFLPARKRPIPLELLVAWLEEVADGTWTWTHNTQCKYITLNIDTCSGVTSILDRDCCEIDFDSLRRQYGDETPIAPKQE